MMTRSWLAAALVGAAMACPAAAEDFVVIESTAPQFAVGSMLGDGQAVDLPAGTRVVLAGSTGRSVSLAGPFSGPVAPGSPAGDSRLVTALSTLLQRKESDTSAVGAVRAADVAWRKESATGLADVLAIDAGDGGEVCLYDPAAAELIRAPTDAATWVTILNAASGANAIVEWEGASRRPWPKDLPIEDGESYILEQPGKSTAGVVTIHVLDDQPPTDLARIAQFIEAGCDGQARLLLATVAKTAK